MSIYMFRFINLYLCFFVFMDFGRFCNSSWNMEENEIRKDLVFSLTDQFLNVLDIYRESNIMLLLTVNDLTW